MATLVNIKEISARGFGACSNPRVLTEPASVRIRFVFATEDSDFNEGEVEFRGVSAYRFTGKPLMKDVNLIDAYDRVSEILKSPWVQEAESAIREKDSSRIQHRPGSMHHYALYFDDHGCYELLAEAFEVRLFEQGRGAQ